jgi:hypothetical protein
MAQEIKATHIKVEPTLDIEETPKSDTDISTRYLKNGRTTTPGWARETENDKYLTKTKSELSCLWKGIDTAWFQIYT